MYNVLMQMLILYFQKGGFSMRKTKKFIAIVCVIAILSGVLGTVGFAAGSDVDYKITNPYANVD
jgi:hypothetical protein